MKIERWLVAGIILLVALGALGAQLGWLNLPAATGAVFGNVAGLKVPDLDDPAMIRRGAGHYDRVCARCHASPERPDQGNDLKLTPPPPILHTRIENFPPEVLFAIVKRGIPNTAMPGWPARHRDDEIWSMVAFLRVLPQMDAADYRALSGLDIDIAAVPPIAQSCARCHGADGRGSPDGAFPRLDLQTTEYLLSALHAFRAEKRDSGIMRSAVAGLTDEELVTLAEHYAGAPQSPLSTEVPVAIARGTEERMPACTACHGPVDIARPEFPRLLGQYESYLVTQLKLFADKEIIRGGGPFVQLMELAAHDLSEAEIAEAAAFYADADPAPVTGN